MRHQLFTAIRADSLCDAGDLDAWTWSLVNEVCRSLDWSVIDRRTATHDGLSTLTTLTIDGTHDPLTLTTYWQHCCVVVDIPPGIDPTDRVTGAVLDAEFVTTADFVVRSGASHPVGGHMISVDELLWFETCRRHWERADLGPTLEELD